MFACTYMKRCVALCVCASVINMMLIVLLTRSSHRFLLKKCNKRSWLEINFLHVVCDACTGAFLIHL